MNSPKTCSPQRQKKTLPLSVRNRFHGIGIKMNGRFLQEFEQVFLGFISCCDPSAQHQHKQMMFAFHLLFRVSLKPKQDQVLRRFENSPRSKDAFTQRKELHPSPPQPATSSAKAHQSAQQNKFLRGFLTIPFEGQHPGSSSNSVVNGHIRHSPHPLR